jgi:ComF family protein
LRSAFGRAAEGLFALAAPPECAACDARIHLSDTWCESCRASFPPIPPPRTVAGLRVCAAYQYAGPIAEAVRRFKFGPRPDLARPLSELLEPLLERLELDAEQRIVPVPLHPRRLAERGFNQAALLARRIARRTPARFLPLSLSRVRYTAAQAQLGRAERLSNAEHAFVARSEQLCGRRIVLVDDVLTTGATALACSEALQQAGARLCAVLVIAQSL